MISLSGNQFTNLAIPEGISNLTTLILSGNKLVGLTLSDLPRLSALDLSGNTLIDLSFLEGLTAWRSSRSFTVN